MPEQNPSQPSAAVRDVPHVVIVGGGFAGLAAAKALGSKSVRVTLVDRQNHHLFQPLLYQVATAGLSGPDIAAPIRQILRACPNTTVLMAEVRRLDPSSQRVQLGDGSELHYDYLIVAAGAETFYFGHDEWREHAPGLKSIEDAFEVRSRILSAYERAEREPDPEVRRQLLTFVVIGGGATGVELSGAIVDIAEHTLAREFRNFDPKETRVLMVEGGRVLAGFSPRLGDKARAALIERGVEVAEGTRAVDIDAAGVSLDDGRRIQSRTVLWAAGVKGSSLGAQLPETHASGRVPVRPNLSLAGFENVFVVGDMMALEQDGEPLPGVAQVAIQSGRAAAMNVLRRVAGKMPHAFRYSDRGMLATVGRSAAVGLLLGREFSGFFAWVIWWLVHVYALIGFRNRFAVMSEWVYAYVTWKRSARVIVTSARDRPERGPDGMGLVK